MVEEFKNREIVKYEPPMLKQVTPTGIEEVAEIQSRYRGGGLDGSGHCVVCGPGQCPKPCPKCY